MLSCLFDCSDNQPWDVRCHHAQGEDGLQTTNPNQPGNLEDGDSQHGTICLQVSNFARWCTFGLR